MNLPADIAPRRSTSLGIVSFILGLIAFLLGWIPFLGLLMIPLEIIGIILGAVGLVVCLAKGRSGLGWAIAGTVISLLALIITLSITAGAAAVINQTAKTFEEAEKRIEAEKAEKNKAKAAEPAATAPSPQPEPAAPPATP